MWPESPVLSVNRLFVSIRSGVVRFHGIIAVPTNTHPRPAAVIDVTFDIRLHRAQVSQPSKFHACNQSSKYAIEIDQYFNRTINATIQSNITFRSVHTSVNVVALMVRVFLSVRRKCLIFSFSVYRSESPDDLDASLQKNNESHVSGISPFFSSEDMNVSINNTPQPCESVSTKGQF